MKQNRCIMFNQHKFGLRILETVIALSVFFLVPVCFACKNNKGNSIQVNYKVQHWKQGLEDLKHRFAEDEILKGVAGEKTKAVAKNYPGFIAQPIEQQKIEGDETTVVNINYDRKKVKITFDPNGGELDEKTPGVEQDGKKTIEALFESPMPNIKAPTKNDKIFMKWEPELPKTFPPDDTVYVAKWGLPFKVKVKGDERTEQDGSKLRTLTLGGTWEEIKDDVSDALIFTSEWKGGDYHDYEWHLNDENGPLLTNDYTLNQDITVYAITNYKPFNALGEFLAGVKGSDPRGKIYIPKNIQIIGEYAFVKRSGQLDVGLKGITNVIFKGCKAIDTIKTHAFQSCEGIESVEFPDTVPIKLIESSAFAYCSKLKKLNLTGCIKLTTIENNAFSNCAKLETVDFSSCPSIKDIGEGVFTGCEAMQTASFAGCSKLTQLSREVFSGCSNLKEVNFTDCSSLNTLGTYAFGYCSALENLDLTPCNNLSSIDAYAFYGAENATIKLPASVTKIGASAFGSAMTLCKGVVVPNDAVKELVKKVGYPEDRITVKP